MKVYKLEVMVLDFDAIGPKNIQEAIDNARYDSCIYPKVKSVEEREIGEWYDYHPLNRPETSDAEYKRLFTEASPSEGHQDG